MIKSFEISSGDLKLTVLNYGARMHDIKLGGMQNGLIRGYHKIEDYLLDGEYRGAVIGPVANRISEAKGSINGQIYSFDANENNRQTLHGGQNNISQVFWSVDRFSSDQITLSLQQDHGVDGFPGQRNYRVTYRIKGREIHADLYAETDQPTPVDMTLHPYFNFDIGKDISQHHLKINADHYLEVNEQNCPTGAVLDVSDTAFDFQNEKSLRPLAQGNAPPIDHYFKCRHGSEIAHLASLINSGSGVQMDLFSSAEGVQCYTGQGMADGAFGAICLEPHQNPDALNHHHFSSIILTPEQAYHHKIIYKFQRIKQD